ncbi:MAG: DUF3592 domain-containing protein [Pirellulaceae bacterium]
MAKYALGTLAVFVASAIWLYLAWASGNQTNSWNPTAAKVISNDTQKTIGGRPAGWLTTITYDVDGQTYKADVDEYLVGNQVTVYVNPNDPTEVVGKAGARIQDMGRPIIATVGSGLFGVVLLLIALSPKED